MAAEERIEEGGQNETRRGTRCEGTRRNEARGTGEDGSRLVEWSQRVKILRWKMREEDRVSGAKEREGTSQEDERCDDCEHRCTELTILRAIGPGLPL